MISIIITDESGEEVPPIEFRSISLAILWLEDYQAKEGKGNE